jgi:DNA primase
MYIPENVVLQLHGLSCEEVATEFGLEVKGHMTHCFKHEDRVPSLGFKGNHWKCFSCNAGGDAISLIQEMFSVSFAEACEILCDKFNIVLPNVGRLPKAKCVNLLTIPRTVSFSPKNTEPEFDREVAEFILMNTKLTRNGMAFVTNERMLDVRTVETLRIHSIDSFSRLRDLLVNSFGKERLKGAKVLKEDGTHMTIDVPSLIIPYYDENGVLIGLQTRYLGKGKPNFKIPRFKRICNSKIRLYNLPVLKRIAGGGKLFITEGITDCLALLSAGYNAVAIPSASSLPMGDLEKLCRFNLYMVSDRDKAGQDSYMRLYGIMLRYGCVLKQVALPTGFKDYSEYYLNSKNKNGERG